MMRAMLAASLMMAVCCSAANAWAEEDAVDLSITASVDKTELTAGEQVTLTITLRGPVTSAKVTDLELPETFVILAEHSAQNMMIKLGQVSYAVTRTYILRPDQAGQYTLGPFQVEHDEQTYATQPIQLDVKPASTSPAAPGKPPAPGQRLVI